MMNRFAPIGVVLVVLVGCGHGSAQVRHAEGKARMVSVAPGVSLEVLDWGGSGRPLVFLAGGGDTAHEFDDFAPLLAKDFRVFGITRRGVGASSHVAAKTPEDYVSDIVAVLDALGLSSVVLVGHSFGGMEMERFAEEHSDRCAGLVYLDAAYNYNDPTLGRLFRQTPPPHAPPMTSSDSASVSAVQAYVKRTQGMTIPESEIRATRRFDSSGRLVGRAPVAANRAVFPAPSWDSIKCRALGIYAIPAPLKNWLPYYGSLDASARKRGHAYYEAFAKWTAAQRKQFGRYPQNEVIQFPSSNHYFFLEKPKLAARMIANWVSGLP